MKKEKCHDCKKENENLNYPSYHPSHIFEVENEDGSISVYRTDFDYEIRCDGCLEDYISSVEERVRNEEEPIEIQPASKGGV